MKATKRLLETNEIYTRIAVALTTNNKDYVDPKTLFKNFEVSEDMKNVVKEYDRLGISPIGAYAYIGDPSDLDAKEVRIDEDNLALIRSAIDADKEKNSIQQFQKGFSIDEMSRRFTDEGFKVKDYPNFDTITFECLKVVYQYGEKALGKRIHMPNKHQDQTVKINQALLYTSRLAIDWLLERYDTADLNYAIEQIKQDNNHFSNAIKLVKQGSVASLSPLQELYLQIGNALHKKYSNKITEHNRRTNELSNFYETL